MNTIHALFLAASAVVLPGIAALAEGGEKDPLVAVGAAGGAADDDADLAKAERLLAASPEPDVRKGADLCVRLNSPESVEMLLEVLRMTAGRGLSAAHYRDVAWIALVKIKDPYARRVVEKEMNSRGTSSEVRQWCAEALGLYGDADFGESLARALGDKSDDVRAAAARAVGRIKYAGAQKALLKRVRAKWPVLRANAIEALALIDGAVHEKVYLKGLRDKDGGVRCALYATAPVAYPDKAEALSVQALADADWRPRMQGVDNLAGIKTKTAVDALIGALDDGRPVVSLRAIKSLQALTHQKHSRPDQWVRWWGDNREAFAFPKGRPGAFDASPNATVSAFNGIRLESDHVAFLLDKSAKMDELLHSRGVTKDEAAQGELQGVFEALQGRLVFNIFCYEMRVRPFSEKGAVKLTRVTAKKALAFHRKSPLSGRKDIWAVLMAVLEDPDLDTAYLLSSGEPDVGLYVHWDRITYQLKELNRFHKVVFHGIAYSDSKWNRDQIEKISEATGGEFQWFE